MRDRKRWRKRKEKEHWKNGKTRKVKKMTWKNRNKKEEKRGKEEKGKKKRGGRKEKDNERIVV